MSYTRQKLLTLISVLLLSLFVGCANQNAQLPAEPDAPTTVISGEWPTLERDLMTLDGSPVTEAHITKLQGDVISSGYNPFSPEHAFTDINKRLAPLGLQVIEEVLEKPKDVKVIEEAVGRGELATQADCPRAVAPNDSFQENFNIGQTVYTNMYTTNNNGYPLSVSFGVNSTRATYKGGGARVCSTSSVGKFGGSIGQYSYQGGHILADRFGGPADRYNLFPQVGRFNTGTFRRIEAIIANNANRLGPNSTIKPTITLEYAGNNIVPYGLNIKLEVFKQSSLIATRQWYYSNGNPDKRDSSGQSNFEYNTQQKDSIKVWLNQQ